MQHSLKMIGIELVSWNLAILVYALNTLIGKSIVLCSTDRILFLSHCRGNIGWCDAILQIRPLPNDYYKTPVLCAKCILDGIPSIEKLSEQQSSAILKILGKLLPIPMRMR